MLLELITPLTWRILHPRDKDEHFVGANDQLELCTQANNYVNLQSAIKDAINSLFEDLIEVGDLEIWCKAHSIDYNLIDDELILPRITYNLTYKHE